MSLPTAADLDRDALVDRYRRARARSRALFNLLDPAAYYERPIALRHPVVFYEGHLPGFALNTLVKRALDEPGIDPALERLFARGIDPDEGAAEQALTWPSREEVQAFAAEADRRIIDAIATGDIVQPGHPLLDRGDAVFAILEHEAMHQETLLYMWHELPHDRKHAPADYRVRPTAPVPAHETVAVPAGRAALGVAPGELPFAWDNEQPARVADVPAFRIDRLNVTNGDFLAFVEAGGYEQPEWWTPRDWAWLQETGTRHPHFWQPSDAGWQWRGMFELLPLPLDWPVYVTHAEAAAYTRWRGRRLPTEAEFQRAAYADPAEGRPYPWGSEAPTAAHGVFDFSGWEPEPVGSHPAGRSPFGVDDMVGNGWEWTSDVFAPFPGFSPSPSYPEYSADFFDGRHYVMKGASPVTAADLIRPTFRNWFRPRYPYVYATFRCAGGDA